MSDQELKVCRKCHLEKPLSEFAVTDRVSGTRRARCKPCESARVREYYAAQPEYRLKAKANTEKQRKANPDRRAVYSRRSSVKGKYGITVDQYADLLAAQHGACALCGTTDHGHKHGNGSLPGRGTGRSSNWPIDHDHKTGVVRGLLCTLCNTQLGSYESLLDRIGEAKVLEYLTRPSPVLSLPVVPVPATPVYRQAEPPPRYTQGLCTVCGEPQHAGGLCFKHYMRARRRNGDAGPAETLPHGGSTLTPDDIRAIRAVPDARGVGAKLAAQYGVSQPTISMIRKRRIWTHVADEVAA